MPVARSPRISGDPQLRDQRTQFRLWHMAHGSRGKNRMASGRSIQSSYRIVTGFDVVREEPP